MQLRMACYESRVVAIYFKDKIFSNKDSIFVKISHDFVTVNCFLNKT